MRQFRIYNLGLLVAGLGLVFFSGCESKEKVALAKAEQCINKSDETNVAACMDHLSGLDSEKADMFRCSIYYIKNGFTGNRLAEAFANVKNNSNAGQDPMIGAMALMAFTSIQEAETAAVYCQRSNVISMIRFSTMTKMATYIASIGGITIPSAGMTPAEMDNAIANFETALAGGLTTEQLDAIGGTVMEAADGYCAEGSAYSSTPICTNLNAAVEADASNQTIIQALIDALQTP